MRIIITEEKSSNMMSKLHNLKKIVSELTECFEECKEESSRNHRYDDEDEYDKAEKILEEMIKVLGNSHADIRSAREELKWNRL